MTRRDDTPDRNRRRFLALSAIGATRRSSAHGRCVRKRRT
jgi:hypothetical protein